MAVTIPNPAALRIMPYNLQCSITETWLLSAVTFCSKAGVGHQQSGNPCNAPHCTVRTNPEGGWLFVSLIHGNAGQLSAL